MTPPKRDKDGGDPAAISGHRIATFFDVRDPSIAGEDALAQAQAAVRNLPDAVADARLPLDEREIKDLALRERAGVLAEWLCGMQTQRAADALEIEGVTFSNWVHHDARPAIGSIAVYDALLSE